MREVRFAPLLLAGSICAAAAQTADQPNAKPPPIDKVIVYIECKSPNGQTTSKGTGVLVNDEGAILTAGHVAPTGFTCLGGIGTAATTPTRKLIRDPRQAPVDAILLRFVRTGGEVFPFVHYQRIHDPLKGKPIVGYGFQTGAPGDTGEPFRADGTIAQTNINGSGIFGTNALQSSRLSGGPVFLKEGDDQIGNLIGIIAGADFDPSSGAPSSYGVLAAQVVANAFELHEAPLEAPHPLRPMPEQRDQYAPGAKIFGVLRDKDVLDVFADTPGCAIWILVSQPIPGGPTVTKSRAVGSITSNTSHF